jgi:outer membrane protein TolC
MVSHQIFINQRTKKMIRKNKQIIILFFIIVWNIQAFSQNQRKLSIDEFLSIVSKYHPIAKQAQLLSQEALANLQIARAGFEPNLYATYDRKTFDNKNYYSYFNNTIKIPVWYGVEIKAGYDYIYGNNINPETKIPNIGQATAGISVPLLKNLLFDSRRAQLQKAKLFIKINEQEQLSMLNDLYYEATIAYNNWAISYTNYEVAKQYISINEDRYNFVKNEVNIGEKAGIDTIEAMTILQNRQQNLLENYYEFLKNTYSLFIFMWLEDEKPALIDTSITPDYNIQNINTDSYNLSFLDSITIQIQQNNPILKLYDYKIKDYMIEKRLAIESLKPTLNVEYYHINSRNKQLENGLFFDNYKLGVTFGLPLAFMEGRAKKSLYNTKIKSTQFELQNKENELINKLKIYYLELINLQKQYWLNISVYNNYKKLLDGESTRFANGESSLFLINARENKTIETQFKLNEILNKYYKTQAAIKWLAIQF